MRFWLECDKCKLKWPGDSALYQCPQCKGRISIQYDYASINKMSWIDDSQNGIWKFWRLLPVNDLSRAVSLGEGWTFLHDCYKLAKQIGIAKLWVKDETTNPTTSFKDRNAAVSITKALEFGAVAVAVASDGNAGPSVAAYAAKVDLPCYVFMPTITAPQDMVRASIYGAQVIKVRGAGLVSDCIDLIEAVKDQFGWHHLTTASPINPYQFEAPKTIIFETILDLKGEIPDWIALPAGGGGLVGAAFKALSELEAIGIIQAKPRILCVQAKTCAPIVQAFQQGTSIRQWECVGLSQAIPLSVPKPLDGDIALVAVKTSAGAAIAVSDAEIVSAQSLLKTEGILASPAGSTALAGVVKARKRGLIDAKAKVLVVVSGGGVKDLAKEAEKITQNFIEIPADPQVFKRKEVINQLEIRRVFKSA